ncbi:hypothetical protein QNO07_00255 [Streptomyces sp. 549]|uniref:hypothetical protein n=1 Tax=Streptomyces sp. 549 TaxID=3049076 RepID=UPI0024C3887B|nr:hypothetical protein [Streptomyces sp. 549]MDK1471871.1 hypothetical protein [Streptomyces sp. 549]
MRSRTALVVATAVATLALTACSTETSTDAKGDTSAPEYTTVQHDDSGNQRTVIVEVDSTNRLRPVFDHVAEGLTEEAGYYIMINCSTGGTDTVDNRLANGLKAIGPIGAATTGLDEGATEYTADPANNCPE